jgi:HEAT repeat protein/YHS domain-containing protein
MTTCPTCGKTVDPLRAPAVSVRDGKVVSFCSRECAAAAESKPVVTSAKPERARTEPPVPPPDKKRTPPKGITKITPPKGVPKATPAAGIPKSAADLDSGPVIEIVHEPASGVVTSAADARSGKAATSSRAETSGAIQIADTGHIDDYVSADEPILHRSRAWVLILMLVVLGGGAFAAYQLGYLDALFKQDSHAATPAPPKPVEVADAGVDAPGITAEAAVAKARDVLRTALHSDSPRVQRLAASALARTGDADAIAALVTTLAKEQSDLAKLDILYALARAGDKRGLDGLVAALAAPRRDMRAEAAHHLAQLGDKRAIDTLAQYLDVSQLRLGAAVELAYLAEPRAVKTLEAVRADPAASADDKARAAIALGYAGKADIAPVLHDLLGDARFNAFAAASLASLHDAAARPVLVKQLEVSALRITAARSLRQLDPSLDPLPLLHPLVAALASAKDTDRVQAAEAILELAGPPAWSVHE